jgi:hypothetical protein
MKCPETAYIQRYLFGRVGIGDSAGLWSPLALPSRTSQPDRDPLHPGMDRKFVALSALHDSSAADAWPSRDVVLASESSSCMLYAESFAMERAVRGDTTADFSDFALLDLLSEMEEMMRPAVMIRIESIYRCRILNQQMTEHWGSHRKWKKGSTLPVTYRC